MQELEHGPEDGHGLCAGGLARSVQAACKAGIFQIAGGHTPLPLAGCTQAAPCRVHICAIFTSAGIFFEV